MSLSGPRQDALLRGMAAVQAQPGDGAPMAAAGDARSKALNYALAVLGDRRTITASDGSFGELLEANDIAHRVVITPPDLAASTRATMIVFALDDGRPLVVHRLGARTLSWDGVSGRRQPLEPALALGPIAYELYASLPLPPRSPAQLLAFAMGGDTAPLLTVLFSALVLATFNLSIPALTAFLVGTVLPLGEQGLIAETSLVVLLLTLCTVVSQGFSSLAAVRLESQLNLRLETALWNHLMRLPLAFFETLGTADLVGRVGAISQMRLLVSNGLLTAGLGLLFSLSNLILMFVFQAQLALVAAGFSLAAAIVMVALVLRSVRLEQPLQQGQALVGEMALQSVAGMVQIRVSGSEPFVFERWITAVVQLGGLLRRGRAADGGLEILARLLTPLGQLLVCGVMVVLLTRARDAAGLPGAATSGALENLANMGSLGPNQLVATFVAFEAAYLSFNSQLSALAQQLAGTVARLLVLWQRSGVVIHASPEAGHRGGIRLLQLRGELRLQGLQVRYPDAPRPLLSEIELTIPQGRCTAITGASGCGKTTLLRCLLRLLEPEAGVISVDGVDLRQLALRPYRRQLGVVLQNAPLPSGSIHELVRAGRAHSRDEIWEALAMAAIAPEVERMPMQLETIINEGATNISGGQRQRLSLARALLGQPKLLLLDEATSALDALTQAAVSRTLASLPITRVVIAHRLSTLESADQIAVIAAGRISELGTYAELSGRSGGYLSKLDN